MTNPIFLRADLFVILIRNLFISILVVKFLIFRYCSFLIQIMLKQPPREEIQVTTKFGRWTALLCRLGVDHIDLCYQHRVHTTVVSNSSCLPSQSEIQNVYMFLVDQNSSCHHTIRYRRFPSPRISEVLVHFCLYSKHVCFEKKSGKYG